MMGELWFLDDLQRIMQWIDNNIWLSLIHKIWEVRGCTCICVTFILLAPLLGLTIFILHETSYLILIYVVWRAFKPMYIEWRNKRIKQKRENRMKQIMKDGIINTRVFIDTMNLIFYVNTSYSPSTTIKCVLKNALNQLNQRCIKSTEPYTFSIDQLLTINTVSIYHQKSLNDPITNYNGEELERIGMIFSVKMQHQHIITNVNITCKYLVKAIKNRNVMHCPIYKAMITDYVYTEYNFDHLCNFVHFRNAYDEQPNCKDSQNCESFIRFQNKSNLLSDRCHNKMYRHPPRRSRQIAMAENFAFIINETTDDNQKSYQPRPETHVQKKKASFEFDATEDAIIAIAVVAEKVPTLPGKIIIGTVAILAGLVVDCAVCGVMKIKVPIQNSVQKLTKKKGDKIRYGFNETDGYLTALIKEVTKNGYKYDL
eukprot:497074_1